MSRDGNTDVVVVGAGAAGLGAALAARNAGATVTVLHSGTSTMSFCGGTWCLAEATEPSVAAAIERAHTAVLPALGLYRALRKSSRRPLWTASEAGAIMTAASAQRAVLDLGALPDARVAVVTLPAWQPRKAHWLAAALTEQAVRRGSKQRFGALEIEFLRRKRDVTSPAHELAEVLDHADARQLLVRATQRALGGGGFEALLLPAVLGLERHSVAEELSRTLGMPVGETHHPLGGTQALRLERACLNALRSAGCALKRTRLESVEISNTAVTAQLQGDASVTAKTMVIATGNALANGGTAPTVSEAETDTAGRFKCNAATQRLESRGTHPNRIFVAGAATAIFDPNRHGLGDALTAGFIAGEQATGSRTPSPTT